MSEPQSNYVQISIPIENADRVFDALCWRFGKSPTDDENKETCARKALIGVIENAVVEHDSMLAIQQVQDNREDLNIT